ncbi:MAG: acetate--CoA ligase family protein [Nitrospiraceae bacterium]|nr:acetate--CoA ligase family protein [Nitrospiraceae bacterium]
MSKDDTVASVREVPPEVIEFIEQNKGRKVFLEHEVKGILKEMGLPVPEGIYLAKGGTAETAARLGYPLVAKVSSRKIASKSDVHGVRTGIPDKKTLQKVVDELMRIDGAEGVLVEEMAPQGVEVIVGGVMDEQFGPVMMFGLGGVFVELFKDVSFGLAPLSHDEALRLVQEVRGYRLLEGFRGRPRVNVEGLAGIIITVSRLMATGLVEEVDLNPVALYPDGALVLDAKMSVFLSQKP